MGAAKNQARIKSVEVNNFRGVRGNLTVSFDNRSGTPVSAVIAGDNGTGKSTIADAIEWACQGATRKGTAGSQRDGLIHLLAMPRTASAAVTLEDGRVLTRTIENQDDKYASTFSGTSGDFSRAPMILKRYDILRLLETKPAERGVLFLHLRLSSSSPAESQSGIQEVPPAEPPLLAIKNQIRACANDLAHLVGYPLLDDRAVSIDQLIKQGVYRGFPRQQASKHNIRIPDEQLRLVRRIDDLRSDLSAAKEQAKGQRSGQAGQAEAQVQRLSQLLVGVDDWLTKSFVRITRASHVKSIHVDFARTGRVAIDFRVELTDGQSADPTAIFSEGYQDLVSLLFFLASLRAAADLGQARVLILDDVLQSVDAPVRVAVMNLIVEEFRDWQLLITVHDRLWRAQVLEILRNHDHPFTEVDLGAWDFTSGASLTAATMDPAASLRTVRDTTDAGAIAAVAGRLLEQIADRLSWTLRVSVQRTRGDLYTLADTWPGVAKQLRKSGLDEQVTDIERWRHLRNISGAHYNEWAEAVPLTDTRAFADSVLDLTAMVYCDACRSWVMPGGRGSAACRCGNRSLVAR